MPLYIRHSCCVKISLFQAKSTPFIHLRHHYSTHFPIIQNPAIPYFISLFTILTKLFQLFILVTPLSHILLHKKRPHLTVRPIPISISISFYLKKRGNECYFLLNFSYACLIFKAISFLLSKRNSSYVIFSQPCGKAFSSSIFKISSSLLPWQTIG